MTKTMESLEHLRLRFYQTSLFDHLVGAGERTERHLDSECLRVAIRYDKLAANDLAFLQLASMRPWLCANESAP